MPIFEKNIEACLIDLAVRLRKKGYNPMRYKGVIVRADGNYNRFAARNIKTGRNVLVSDKFLLPFGSGLSTELMQRTLDNYLPPGKKVVTKTVKFKKVFKRFFGR